MQQELRQRQEKRSLWLAQRRAEVFAEAKEHFHVPSVVGDAGDLHPDSGLAGVKAAQPVTAGRNHTVLGKHCGDHPNVLTQEQEQDLKQKEQ